MADVVWEDMNCRARKVEGGYESVLIWDEEELVVNFIPFEVIARSEEEELGRKPTPEEVDQRCLEIARNPKSGHCRHAAATEARGGKGLGRLRITGRGFANSSGCRIWRGNWRF